MKEGRKFVQDFDLTGLVSETCILGNVKKIVTAERKIARQLQ